MNRDVVIDTENSEFIIADVHSEVHSEFPSIRLEIINAFILIHNFLCFKWCGDLCFQRNNVMVLWFIMG